MAHIFEHTSFVSTVTFVEKVRTFMEAHAKHRSDQRTYGRMLNMSNRDLADIGLTRNDVRQAMKQTFSQPDTR